MQSTGAFFAVQRYASATHMPASVLSRGVGWQVNRAFYSLNSTPTRQNTLEERE